MTVKDTIGKKINAPIDIVTTLIKMIGKKQKEYFVVCCLDSANKVKKIEVVSIGTINRTLVHPREVFFSAVKTLSAAIIVAHNHPSGEITASSDDITVTKRLVDAGKILGIHIYDHIIVTKDNFNSLKERGVIV